MKRFPPVALLAAAVMLVAAGGAGATTIIGDLNNFDTLNDTGQTCYGFEIEIDDIRSTDVTYTFDWNHYGAPKIREDTTDPLHPKVFVRYESTKDSNGAWGANGSFTNVASPTITPPAGHTCTDTSVNLGCEHFGVGYYGVPTTIKYNWLIDGGAGTLAYFGTPVSVATPKWVYTPPAPAQPAQVVAAIPAPVVPIPANKQFGEPSWVKVIKTTTHNVNNVELKNLISDDVNSDGLADWTNGEPDQVETEWKLLQTNTGANPGKEELPGGADDMGLAGDEIVTRRYEFYRYAGDATTIDGENGEAMCDTVNPTTNPADALYLHGVGTAVAVTDANGVTQYVDCTAQIVVGNYIGAQMAGFDAAAVLGLIDNLQDGEQDQPYTPRTVVIGGESPYAISVTGGSLPDGLVLGDNGVLSGAPTVSGDFTFTVDVTDAGSATASKAYTLHIAAAIVPTTTTTTTLEPTTTTSTSSTTSTLEPTTTSSTTSSTTLEPTTSTSTSSTTSTLEPTTTSSTTSSTTLEPTTSTSTSSTTTTLVPPMQQYALGVAVTGSGKVTSSPKGIRCGKQCSESYTVGTAVTLTAKPANKHSFAGWTGACSGTSLTCTVSMLGDLAVGAEFN